MKILGGSIFTFNGSKFKGKAAFEKGLLNDTDMYDELYTAMLAAAYKDSLKSKVPEVWDYND